MIKRYKGNMLNIFSTALTDLDRMAEENEQEAQRLHPYKVYGEPDLLPQTLEKNHFIDPRNDVGDLFSSIVQHPPTAITQTIYKAHTPRLVQSIKDHFPDVRTLRCLEYGGGNGALVEDICQLLPEYELDFTNVDQSEELLAQDKVSRRKIVSRLEDFTLTSCTDEKYNGKMNCSDKFDLIVMRYVLHFNTPLVQYKLLQQAQEMLMEQGLFLLQHVGGTNKYHATLADKMMSGSVVSQMRRSSPNWTPWEQMASMLYTAQFNTKVVERFCLPISDFFKLRYELSDEDETKRKEWMGSYDFLEYVICENRKIKSYETCEWICIGG